MRRKALRPAGPLPDLVARFLLADFDGIAGWHDLPLAEQSEVADVYFGGESTYAELWAAHGAYLRAKAAEWGITPARRDAAGRRYFAHEPREANQ